MNGNIVTSLDSATELCNIIQECLDENETAKALEALGELRKEILAIAYNVQSVRNHIKIAGKNLTEAFEKVLVLPKEDVQE